MTAKEKAKELVDSFMSYKPTKMSDYSRIEYPTAKAFALIAVDEILNNVMKYWEITPDNYCIKSKMYWNEVKQEINKL